MATKRNSKSETVTENIFRKKYGATTFIEKSAISSGYGFKSKVGTEYKGYPDFFKEERDYCIVVEAKADDMDAAEKETQYYMLNNKIHKDIIGIAVSGQKENALKVSYYLLTLVDRQIIPLKEKDSLMSLKDIYHAYLRNKYGKPVSDEALVKVLTTLNKRFQDSDKVRDTDRSLFFSGIMIALKNNNFRSTYENIQAPISLGKASKSKTIEAANLNDAMLNAITDELKGKINSHSKVFNWYDKFSFIKNIDFALDEYKEIIKKIECEIFYPFQYGTKQDILGRAYKIFLSRAGKVDNKNIILTPDHIKKLMVKLARLNEHDVVLDTCTGSGGFLMEAMEEMINQAAGNVKRIKSIKEKQLIGFENDPVLFALACSNMFLHGDGRSNLIYRSSLLGESQDGIADGSDKELKTYIKKQKPTKVIINPPYEANKPIKFVDQAIDYLEPNGKLIVIMPTPTLTRNQDGMTKEILKKAKLDFVIKMPDNLFAEQKRTVNTSIFGFTKTPQQKMDDVLFYDLSDDGFESVQHKGRINKNGTWDNLQKELLDLILNSKEKSGVCVKKKIYEGDILNCAGFQKKTSQGRKLVRINELFDIIKGSLQSSKNIPGPYPFVTGAEDWKNHVSFEHDCEAIVFVTSAAGSLGRTHYVNGKFIASDLCAVLIPKDNGKYPINVQFYNYYFAAIRDQIVADLKDGTSKLTINPIELGNYFVSYYDLNEQNAFVKNKVAAYVKARDDYHKATKTFKSELEKLK